MPLHKHSSLRALLLVLASTSLTACPRTHSEGDAAVVPTSDAGPLPDAPAPVEPPPDAPVTVDEDGGRSFPAAVTCQNAADYCVALYECGSEERLAWERERFWHRDVLDCMAIMKPLFDIACDALAEAVEAGTTVVDREALDDCRSPRVSCEDRLEDAWPFDRCALAPIATGGLGPSLPCRWDHECGVGLACNVSDGSHLPPGEHVGACEPLPDAGEPCKPGRCAGELTCLDAVCVDLEVELLAPCLLDEECGPNLRCDQPGNDFRDDEAGDVEGVCRARVGLGEPCDGVQACSPGLSCSSDADGEDGYRLPGACIVPRGSGEPCRHDDDCESSACVELGCE